MHFNTIGFIAILFILKTTSGLGLFESFFTEYSGNNYATECLEMIVNKG